MRTGRPPKPLLERLMNRVTKLDSGCWIFNGPEGRGGYRTIGSGGAGGRTLLAHRVAYTLLVGPIPDGLTLDHLCRTRACVNPEHLEPVTNAENVLRGNGPAALNARKTHCKHGHEFTPENTYEYRGDRICRRCARERTRLFRQTPEAKARHAELERIRRRERREATA